MATGQKYWQHSFDVPRAEGQPDGKPCRQGPFCASAVTAEGPGGPERVPLKGPRAFCDPDRGKVAASLGALTRDYAALAADLGNPGQPGSVRSPFGPRVPLRLGSEALMRAIGESLLSWHDRVADISSLSPLEDRDRQGRRIAREGWLIDRAVRVLSPRLDVLLALQPEPMRRAATHHLVLLLGDDAPDGTVRSGYAALLPELDGGDAGLEVLRLHRMAKAVLGETRPHAETFDGIPCRVPECEAFALERAEPPSESGDAAMKSVCALCGDTMTHEEFDLHARRYARWAQTADFPECHRCAGGRHDQCSWSACPCRSRGHSPVPIRGNSIQ